MNQRPRVRGRQQPRGLLLAAVTCGVLAVAGCSPAYEVAATSTPPSAPECLPPLVADATDSRPSDRAVAATMPASTPVRLRIPAIGVDSDLMGLGLQPEGTLEVPPRRVPRRLVHRLAHTRRARPGDHIMVTRQDGSTARFRVTHVDRFDKDDFPTQLVYGDLDHVGLRPITCGGSFDLQLRSYDDNLVVFAELA